MNDDTRLDAATLDDFQRMQLDAWIEDNVRPEHQFDARYAMVSWLDDNQDYLDAGHSWPEVLSACGYSDGSFGRRAPRWHVGR